MMNEQYLRRRLRAARLRMEIILVLAVLLAAAGMWLGWEGQPLAGAVMLAAGAGGWLLSREQLDAMEEDEWELLRTQRLQMEEDKVTFEQEVEELLRKRGILKDNFPAGGGPPSYRGPGSDRGAAAGGGEHSV